MSMYRLPHSWESLGLQGDPTSPFWRRAALGFLWEEWCQTPVLWPPHAKSCLIGKDSDAGRDWGQEEKGTTEDEMAGWHHWLDGGESEWTPGVGDGQGGLACCDSWGRKESDMTERLNWTDTSDIQIIPYLIHCDDVWKIFFFWEKTWFLNFRSLFVIMCYKLIL